VHAPQRAIHQVDVEPAAGLVAGDTASGAIGVIAQAALTVTANDAAKTYDRQAWSGGNGVTYSGFVNGETSAVLGGTLVYGGSGQGAVNAGTYAIGASGLSAGNYAIGYADGSLVVNKAPLTLAAVGDSRSYDATPASSGAVQVGGLLAGDSIASLSQSFDSKNAGARTLSVDGGWVLNDGNGGNNYTVATSGAAGSIAKAELAVTGVAAADKVYDGTTAASLSGGAIARLGTDAVALATGAAVGSFADKNAAAHQAVSAGGYTISGADADNYTLVQPSGLSADITPRVVSVIGLAADAKVYDATRNVAISNWGTVATGIGGETLTLNHGLAGFDDADAGSGRSVTASGYALSNGSGLASNYQLASTSASTTADIAKAVLTVSANGDAKFVTQADTAGYNGVSYGGFVGGETAAVLGAAPTVTRSGAGDGIGTGSQAAGSYAGVLVPGGGAAANYTLSYVNGDYRILPADQLLVRVSNQAGVYGSADGYTVTSAQYLNSVSGLIADLTQTGANGNTYTFSDGVGGSATFTLGASGAVISGSGHLAVGNYAVTGTDTSIGGSNFNALSFVGNQTVTPKALTLLASAGNGKVYDGTTAMTGLAVGLTGQFAGDALTAGGVGAFDSRNVGSAIGYTVTNVALGGADAADYFTAGRFNATDGAITPATLTLSAVADHKVYDTTRASSGAVAVAGLVAGDTIDGLHQVFDSKNAGARGLSVDAGWSVSDGNGGANYTVNTVAAAGSIAKAELVVSGVTVAGKVYDGTTAATLAGGTVTALGSDAVAVVAGSGTGTFGDRNVGTQKAVSVGGFTLTGADAGNYEVVQPSGLAADITPKPVSLTAPTVVRVYDGTTVYAVSAADLAEFTRQLGVTGDAVGAITLAFGDKDVGSGKTLSPSGAVIDDGNGGANYSVSYVADHGSGITPAQSGGGGNGNGNGSAGSGSGSATSVGAIQSAIERGDAVRSSDERPTTVSLLQNATGEAPGLVQVRLGEQAQRTDAFGFELPREVQQALRDEAPMPFAERADGGALPAWLVFDATRLCFSAVAVPDDGVPLDVVIHAGGLRLRVEIR
jgi:hypothetical protein